MHYFYGILGVVLGFSLIKYRYYLYKYLGTWSLAERFLGSGGTVTAIVLIGFLVIIISIMIFFDQFDTLFEDNISEYVNGGRKK